MKSVWETYKGKKILFARYDHLSLEELRAEVAAVENEILKERLDSVLVIIDIHGTLISPAVLTIIKNTGLRCRKVIHKTAILGVTGARRVFVDIVAKFSNMAGSPLDDVAHARDWLVS